MHQSQSEPADAGAQQAIATDLRLWTRSMGTTRQTSALMPSALAMWRAFAAERPARRSGDRPKHKPRRFGSSDSGCFSERCSEQVIVSCHLDLHSAKHPCSVIAGRTNGGTRKSGGARLQNNAVMPSLTSPPARAGDPFGLVNEDFLRSSEPHSTRDICDSLKIC